MCRVHCLITFLEHLVASLLLGKLGLHKILHKVSEVAMIEALFLVSNASLKSATPLDLLILATFILILLNMNLS